MDRWVGKTAVVTGASAGIGAAIVVSLANAGLNVVGLARRQELIDDLKSKIVGKGQLHSRRCDVSNPDEVAATFAWVEETFGGIDVLINNAAIIHHGSITEVGPNPLTVEELMALIDVNIKSVVLCARQASRSMHKRKFPGHIININSIAGHYIPNYPIFNVYTATKHAVSAITQIIHREFGSFQANIKISSVSPGLVQTDMVQMRKIPSLQSLASKEPMLQPADIADAVVYLLSTPPHVNIDELTITPLGENRL